MKGFFHKLSTNMIEWKQNTFTKYTIYTFVWIGVQIWLPAQALYIHCISILHRIPQRPLSILNCSLYSYRFVHIPCICDVDKKSKIRRRPLPMKIFHSYWIQTILVIAFHPYEFIVLVFNFIHISIIGEFLLTWQ
jgi:hypothetical protein